MVQQIEQGQRKQITSSFVCNLSFSFWEFVKLWDKSFRTDFVTNVALLWSLGATIDNSMQVETWYNPTYNRAQRSPRVDDVDRRWKSKRKSDSLLVEIMSHANTDCHKTASAKPVDATGQFFEASLRANYCNMATLFCLPPLLTGNQ